MRDELRRRLADLGAADDDLDRAEREGWIPLLALDRVLLPGAPIYDVSGVARATGVDESLLHRLWLALGFPDVPSDAQVFTESEVAAARRLFARAQADDLDRDALVRQVRVVSASMARVASVEADAIVDVIYRLAAAGTPVDDIAAIVALVFAQPERYLGKAFDIAGDELTFPDAAVALSAALGEPVRYVQITWEAVRERSEDLYLMNRWLEQKGYRADIDRVRKMHPELLDLGAWLQRGGARALAQRWAA